jgi:hypothetical protein
MRASDGRTIQERPRSGCASLLRVADSWRGGVALFGLALIAYGIEALAWPLQRGRDSWDYWLYYLQLADRHPPFSDVQLFRTPLTPIVTGLPMSIGGAGLLEIVMALMYAGAVVAWAWAARPFGRGAALATAAAVLVLQLPYAALFHEVSSDFLFGALLPLWAGFVVRAAVRPTWPTFVGIGLGAAALTLTRPAGEVLVLAAVLAALVPRGPWRVRGMRVGVAAASVILPLVVWAGVNAARYDDFTVARGGKAWVPFYKSIRWYDPGNGSASRRLAAAVERDVLSLPAYRRLNVGVRTYFHGTSNLEFIRLIALSDRDFGEGSNYDVLYDAGVEAVRRHFGAYVDDVGSTYWRFLTQRFSLEPVRRTRSYPQEPLVQRVDGKPMPTAFAVTPVLQAVRYGFVWCPTENIDRCIVSDPAQAFTLPRDQRRYRQLVDRVRDWNAQLPRRDSKTWLARKLGTISWNTPSAIVWIAIGALAIAARRPRAWPSLLVLLAGAGLVLLIHALSQDPQNEYELPLAPLFVLVGVAAVVGPRARAAGDDA